MQDHDTGDAFLNVAVEPSALAVPAVIIYQVIMAARDDFKIFFKMARKFPLIP